MPKVTRRNSPNARAEPWKPQPRVSFLYSHQARRSDDDESPGAHHKARQQYVVFCFYAIGGPKKNKITSSVSSAAEHFQRKRSPRSALRRDACVPCALPFSVFTAAVVCASLHPIEWQADHRDAPPSPQQSLISERTPSLQRAANGGRGKSESLAASAPRLAERSRPSLPRPAPLRSLFSSMSSSVGGEARCKKCPHGPVLSSAARTHAQECHK